LTWRGQSEHRVPGSAVVRGFPPLAIELSIELFKTGTLPYPGRVMFTRGSAARAGCVAPMVFALTAGCGERVNVELVAEGFACSEEVCRAENPCCHSCSHQGGWKVVDRSVAKIEMATGTDALPACPVDGCGRCTTTISAEGRLNGDTLTITAWTKKAHASP
jgi:hypothetical protein